MNERPNREIILPVGAIAILRLQCVMTANVPFVDADYDKDSWFARAKGEGDGMGARARHPLHHVL